jgi:hypothetical protein
MPGSSQLMPEGDWRREAGHVGSKVTTNPEGRIFGVGIFLN